MTSHIYQLVDDGLLRKVPDEKDRRIIRVVTTPEGRRVRDKYRKIFDDHIEEKLSLLSSIELEEFYKSVETIKKVALKFINTKKFIK
jgi:DNA-binding MarR family transcriptional regulator